MTEDRDALSSRSLRFVPLSSQQPGPVEFESLDRSRELLEQALDDGNDYFK